MEFGALICTPFPDCDSCFLSSKCKAYKQNIVEKLPIKLKKKKVKERFFNYIVLVDPKNKTLIEKRIKKDIWFKLNQFPLIETNFKVKNINKVSSFIKFINSQKILTKTNTFSKYNIKHVLSHQVLYISFYIFKTEKDIPQGIDLLGLSNYNFPVPIYNFINKKLM